VGFGPAATAGASVQLPELREIWRGGPCRHQGLRGESPTLEAGLCLVEAGSHSAGHQPGVGLMEALRRPPSTGSSSQHSSTSARKRGWAGVSPDGRLEGLCLKSGLFGDERIAYSPCSSDGEGLTRLAGCPAPAGPAQLAAACAVVHCCQFAGEWGQRPANGFRQLRLRAATSQLAQRLETLRRVAQALARALPAAGAQWRWVAGGPRRLLEVGQFGRLEQVGQESTSPVPSRLAGFAVTGHGVRT